MNKKISKQKTKTTINYKVELLEELCQIPGISGREQKVIDVMQRELKKTCDEVSVDNLGNVLGLKKCAKKNALKVMIAGHMDEIGFVVQYIDDKGFLCFTPRGGHVPRVLINQRVKIYGKNKTYTGIVESSPAFLDRESFHKVPDFKKMFIDTGVSVEEIKKEIEIGDPIVMEGAFIEQSDQFISKAFDNRIGCFVALEAMRKIKDEKIKLSVDVYALGSSQEEVGVRGARAAAVNTTPDIGIALDVTAAFDTPSVPPSEQVTKLGEGVAIKISDMGSISNHGLVKTFKAHAERHSIKYQMELLPFGGTDASGFQMQGAAVMTLSIPCRYVHSPTEMINRYDVQAAIDLLVKFLEHAHECKLEF